MNPTRRIVGFRSAAAATMLAWALAGCGGPPSSRPPAAGKEAPPAKVTGAPQEAALSLVTLSEEAERRLGVETVEAADRPLPLVREVAGELIVPPGKTMLLSATAGGTIAAAERGIPEPGSVVRKGQVLLRLVPLVPLQRDLLVTYETDLAAAKARFEAAQQQRQRAQQLVKDQAGSQRGLEQAEQEYRQAEAALQAATTRLERLRQRPLDADVTVDIAAPDDGVVRQVFVAPGVQVNNGAALVEVVNLRTLWVRVPVYAGDAARIDLTQAVRVETLAPASQSKPRTGRRVAGPPSADPAAVSIDVYYEVGNTDAALRPGEKVRVALPFAATAAGVVVPSSAIVYDMNGGTWVYVLTAPHQYQRRRVQVVRESSGEALIGRGVLAGDTVVTVAVAEIFGAEFGIGK